MSGAHHRLAIYGTLAPGRSNHHQVAMIPGSWRHGTVRGRLLPEGWGAALGYPAIELDPDGPEVAVQVLDHRSLPDHWERLDAFEGDGYRREICEVDLGGEIIAASIYVLNR
ncbi:MAG: gamma-glutamylcyclotransferase [Novosphingobium sp.]